MRWILIAIGVLLLMCVGGGYYVWQDLRQVPEVVVGDEAAVRQVVTEFGLALEGVRVDNPFAPRDIDEGYSAFVAREQLLVWAVDPASAPGRYADEVWPQRIEIDSVTPLNEQNYTVSARIVYVVDAGGDTSKWLEPVIDEPITLNVSKRGDVWQIIRYESAGQQVREGNVVSEE